MMNWKVCNKPLKMVVVWLVFFPPENSHFFSQNTAHHTVSGYNSSENKRNIWAVILRLS